MPKVLLEKVIRKHALENAIKYHGKANAGSVIGKVISEFQKEDKQKLIQKVLKAVKEVNELSLAEQLKEAEQHYPEILEKKEKTKEERILPELPNVNKKVVMRFAPYPSGPLHIGNARPAILNDEYCKKYNGKLLLIIDDTIGSEEKNIEPDAYKLIPEGLKWLKVDYDKNIIYKSDRLETYYKHAEELINKGGAYVCSCQSETLQEKRRNKEECAHRGQDIAMNLELWKAMFDAKEGSAALRLKTDMQHPNPAFRDRVLFRISDREHPRVGKRYRVWPMLEFSWAVDDYLLGITHVVRGKELMIESEMQRFIWNILGWKGPELLHTGLIQFKGVKLSKSKSKQEVKSGKYTGWDDPRTWSLQSLERRGFKPEAVRTFILSFGMNQTEITVPIETLHSENRKLINLEANRYFFVENMQKIKVDGVPKTLAKVEAPLHPEDGKRGKRALKIGNMFYIDDKLQPGKVYRLMHGFNFKDGKFLNQEVDPALEATLIHWLPADDDLVKIEVLMDDGSKTHGFGEPALRNVKEGQLVQFERKFFCRLDRKENDKMIFWFLHR